MPWFIYALITPAVYSVSNFIDKYIIERKIKEPVILTIYSGLITFFIGLIILFLSGFPILDLKDLFLILLAGVLLDFYILPYYKALKLDDTSRVVPLFQFIPIFGLILSFIFLDETVGMRQLVGIIVVVIGGFLLSTERSATSVLKPRKSLWYMLLSALLYAVVGIIFRFVVRSKDFWSTLGWEYVGIGLGALILFLLTSKRSKIPREIKRIKSILGLITINDGFAIVAQISESYAFSLVAVPLVNSVGGTQPLFLLIYGLILTKLFPKVIKEDIGKSTVGIKLISALITLIGLYLIYFN